MKKSSIKIILLAALGLFSVPEAKADTLDLSGALAYCSSCQANRNGHTSGARGYAPVNTSETGTPEVSERDLMMQLSPGYRQIYQSLDQQGKQRALELASDHYRYNKDAAVGAAREMMQERLQQSNSAPAANPNGNGNGNGNGNNNGNGNGN